MKKSKMKKSVIIRTNIIETTDNHIMIDSTALVSVLQHYIIEKLSSSETVDPATIIVLEQMKRKLDDIVDTALLRIEEQNCSDSKYIRNTLKEIKIEL